MVFHLVPRSLRYVEAVTEHGSMQAASRAIGISASSIDRQIVLLEEWLGVKLFDRAPKGMTLSPVGESLVALARRWRQDEIRFCSDVKQMQGINVGHVRLVVMDSLVTGLIPEFVGRITERYERVRIDVEVGTPDAAQAALADGAADIAVAFNLGSERDLHVLWSADLPLVCVLSPTHPLASEKSLSVKQVRNHRLVLQSPSLAIRRMLEARHEWHFSDSQPPVVTNSLQLLKRLVVAGEHVALTSKLDVVTELLDGSLVSIPVTDAAVKSQSISVAVSAKRTAPKISMLVAKSLVEDLSKALNTIGGGDQAK